MTVFACDTGPWGRAVTEWARAQPPAWNALLQVCAGCPGGLPGPDWLAVAGQRAADLPDVHPQTTRWIQTVELVRSEGDLRGPALSVEEVRLLRGLIWAISQVPTRKTARSLTRFALRCDARVQDHGAANPALAATCILALGALPKNAGIAHLTHLRRRLLHTAAQQTVARSLGIAAREADDSSDAVEERSIPGFDLQEGRARALVDVYAADLVVDSGGARLEWSGPRGVIEQDQLEIPEAALQDQLDRLSEVQWVLESQPARIEGQWLREHTISGANLWANGLNHPLVGSLIRRLLWRVDGTTVHWADGRLLTLSGNEHIAAADSSCTLWHPAGVALELRMIWADRLAALGIEQPFPQVYRPVYQGGIGEMSSHFMGRVLGQRNLVSACRRRRWRYGLQGPATAGDSPHLALPDHGLRLDLETIPIHREGEDERFSTHVVTAGVLLCDSLERAVDPSSLPPIVASELFYEVERLVSESAAANDPTRDSDSFLRVWSWAPLREPGLQRLERLRVVIERTTLRGRVQFDACAVVVGRFAVHVGSGQVRLDRRFIGMAVNPEWHRQAAMAALPSGGDALLVDVLAKALECGSAALNLGQKPKESIT